jgi:hypothetical protein
MKERGHRNSSRARDVMSELRSAFLFHGRIFVELPRVWILRELDARCHDYSVLSISVFDGGFHTSLLPLACHGQSALR